MNEFSDFEHSSGLWAASLNGDYRGKIWIRDCVYILLCNIILGNKEKSQKAYDMLGILWAEYKDRRPPICFDSNLNPISISNFLTGESADIQNDTLGEMLWIYSFCNDHGYKSHKAWKDVVPRIIQLLEEEKYWEQPDSGIWEMEEEIRASSIGICVAGLRSLRTFGNDERIRWLANKGALEVFQLFPGETKNRKYDAVLLNLVWPFRMLPNSSCLEIIKSIVSNLKRQNAVIRFFGDPYYKNNNSEAEWSMFLPHLLLAMKSQGIYFPDKKYEDWMDLVKNYNYPESFIGGKLEVNKNTPLAWSKAMYLMAEKILHNE